jgi:hypothetical protein
MPEKRNSQIASERVVREDAAGVERLAAAPGDPIPNDDDTMPAAPGITMAPQQWDSEARRFQAGPSDPNAENADAANAAQGEPSP